jgi:signal transduction histidine kinase
MASPSTPPSSWNHSTWTWEPPELPAPPGVTAFQRVWRTFMMARLGIAVALLALLGGMMVLGLVPLDYWQLSLCAVYLGGVLAVRLLTRPAPRGRSFDPQWVSTIGVDLLTFSTLHFLQTAGLNFTPLFALPVLTASVLGSTLLALGTAASVALLLLVDAWLQALHLAEFAPRLAQAGLAGGGYFLIALLANQLAMRLEREENAARRSLSAARTQTHVNQVVIESLSDGLLVVGEDWRIHAANPSARDLLGWEAREAPASLALVSRPGWKPLAALAQRTFDTGSAQSAELALDLAAGERLHLRVQAPSTDWLELDQVVQAQVGEWQRHAAGGDRVRLHLASSPAWAAFDGEHLRRILVNLLDNALRYASPAPGAILVATDLHAAEARLHVWSNGGPLDPGVQRHLFEPFFSSESRSSGLGLYICRELCDRHGARIAYAREKAPDGSSREGNSFSVTFRTRTTVAPDGTPFATIRA